MSEFAFKDPEVAKAFVPVDVKEDFKIRVPQANWPERGNPGFFSTINVAAAEQLIAEKYNRISRKEEKKAK